MSKAVIVIGTRPDLIKQAPVIRAMQEALKKGSTMEYVTLHAGQHWSDNMDAVFLSDLKLTPHHRLETSHGTYAQQIRETLGGARKILADLQPSVVVVYGDTLSAWACAMAAACEGIDVAHVEAGMRTEPQDLRLPEETFRSQIDAVARWLFAPTQYQAGNLTREGHSKNRIFVVGNTVLDIVESFRASISLEPRAWRGLTLKPRKYLVLTLHRAENVDDYVWLRKALKILGAGKSLGMELVWPIHPRTQKRMAEFGLKAPKGVTTTGPIGYLDMMRLVMNAATVLTDSGGIPEECMILRVPCLILRRSTERPEVLHSGCAKMLDVMAANEFILKRMIKDATLTARNWNHPYGTVGVGTRIVDILRAAYP